MNQNNPLKRIAMAAVSFFSGLMGIYVGYPMMTSFLDALPSDPIVAGIAWIGFIMLIILAIIVVPMYELFQLSNDTEQTG